MIISVESHHGFSLAIVNESMSSAHHSPSKGRDDVVTPECSPAREHERDRGNDTRPEAFDPVLSKPPGPFVDGAGTRQKARAEPKGQER
jgi:hypothetical protein